LPRTAGVLALNQRVGFDGSLALFVVYFHSMHAFWRGFAGYSFVSNRYPFSFDSVEFSLLENSTEADKMEMRGKSFDSI